MENRLLEKKWVVVALFLVAYGCGKKEESAATVQAPVTAPAETIDSGKLRKFSPVPEQIVSERNPITEQKVVLGRMLFYDTRLSVNEKISCNSCHDLENYGVDGEPTSLGHDGKRGTRNSPSVYHAAGHLAQFWDGRSPDVEDQAKGPVLNPVEMGMPKADEVVARLKRIAGYKDVFKHAFTTEAEPVNFDNLAKAIGAFERRLVTPARWDELLKGNQNALSISEKNGFNDFMEVGCVTCHAGTYLGGNLYQKVGISKPWPNTSDPGRQEVTKDESDNMVFKVPSLRNIEKTGPYYHDGQVKTLAQAVSTMAEYELGEKLSEQQVGSIITFLKALTGEIPSAYIKKPALPK